MSGSTSWAALCNLRCSITARSFRHPAGIPDLFPHRLHPGAYDAHGLLRSGETKNPALLRRDGAGDVGRGGQHPRPPARETRVVDSSISGTTPCSAGPRSTSPTPRSSSAPSFCSSIITVRKNDANWRNWAVNRYRPPLSRPHRARPIPCRSPLPGTSLVVKRQVRRRDCFSGSTLNVR